METLHIWAANCPDDQRLALSVHIAAVLKAGKGALVTVRYESHAVEIQGNLLRLLDRAVAEKCRFVEEHVLMAHYGAKGTGSDYDGPFMNVKQNERTQ
jgi:hypothetical protein